MFTGPGLLALADLLPVMTAYVDRTEPSASSTVPMPSGSGIPRKEILGRTMRDILGEKNYAERKPLIDAAMAGERKFFAATYEHPQRGKLALQVDYVPWIAPGELRSRKASASSSTTSPSSASPSARSARARSDSDGLPIRRLP